MIHSWTIVTFKLQFDIFMLLMFMYYWGLKECLTLEGVSAWQGLEEASSVSLLVEVSFLMGQWVIQDNFAVPWSLVDEGAQPSGGLTWLSDSPGLWLRHCPDWTTCCWWSWCCCIVVVVIVGCCWWLTSWTQGPKYRASESVLLASSLSQETPCKYCPQADGSLSHHMVTI